MEACTTWQCINSFAPWLSALGTLLVSGMSLWLATRDRRVSLSIRADNGFMVHPVRGNIPTITVCITNVGPRAALITNYSWLLREGLFKKSQVITLPFHDPVFSAYCTKLPVELTDGKQANFFHPADYFRLNGNERTFFAHPFLAAWWRIHTVRIRAHVSIGSPRSARPHRRFRRLLWKQYREFRKTSQAA